jgi:SEC-C motif
MMGHVQDYIHHSGPSIMDAPYVTAVGRLDSFAKHLLSDGRTPVGPMLLRLLQDVLALEAADGTVPPSCARVLPGNKRSHRAFDAAEYINFPKAETGRDLQDIRWHPAGQPEAPLDPTVYLPPTELPGGPRPQTIARPAGAGRNELCPCLSGRKYKKCCGFYQR